MVIFLLGLYGTTVIYGEMQYSTEFMQADDSPAAGTEKQASSSEFSRAEQKAFELVLIDRHFSHWLMSLLGATGIACVAAYTLLGLHRLDGLVEDRFRRQYVAGEFELAYVDHEEEKLRRNQIAVVVLCLAAILSQALGGWGSVHLVHQHKIARRYLQSLNILLAFAAIFLIVTSVKMVSSAGSMVRVITA
eukprot:SAG22_NODE_2802_length_2199_cov_1.524286_2_plen_191_part_00